MEKIHQLSTAYLGTPLFAKMPPTRKNISLPGEGLSIKRETRSSEITLFLLKAKQEFVFVISNGLFDRKREERNFQALTETALQYIENKVS